MGKKPLTGNEATRGRAYGSQLGERLGVPKPPSHVHQTLSRGTLAITELKSGALLRDPTSSFGYDDAYQVIVNFRHIRLGLWLNDSKPITDAMHVGKTYIADLRREPRVLIQDPLHTVNFYMPIATLKVLSEQNEMPIFREFPQSPIAGQDDPVMRQLARAAAAVFTCSHSTTGLVIDSILDAVCINMIGHYASTNRNAPIKARGLAPWQERRAKELIDQRLDVSMAELAQECGLSVAHFGRAFKRSTGLAPHQWQLRHRTKRAQVLLAASTLPIAEVAIACGFSSQSHFNSSFKEQTGISPGRWRRLNTTGA